MDSEQASNAYKRAGQLHKEAKYTEALAILDGLDKAFPNTKNIIFARVRCMAAMNRLSHAIEGCNYLMQQFQHQGAHQLKTELEAKLAAPPMPDIPDIGLDMGASAFSAVPPTAAAQGSSMSGMKLAMIIGGAFLLLFVVGTILMVVFTDYGEREPASGTQTAQSSSDYERKLANLENMSDEEFEEFLPELLNHNIGLVIVFGLFSLLTFPAPLYLTLLFTGNLPHGEFWKDYFNAAFVSLGVGLVSGLCPFIGWAIGLFILVKVYDLGFVDILIYIGFSFAYGFVLALILGVLGSVAF